MAQMFRILGKRGRITIPFEIRQRVGFSYNDVLSFTEAPDGRTVIVKREKIIGTYGRRQEKSSLRIFPQRTLLSLFGRRLPREKVLKQSRNDCHP